MTTNKQKISYIFDKNKLIQNPKQLKIQKLIIKQAKIKGKDYGNNQ